MNRPQDKEQDKRQGQQSGMPQTNRPDEDMANQQSKRPSAGERASDQDERFGPGSSRDNDKSETRRAVKTPAAHAAVSPTIPVETTRPFPLVPRSSPHRGNERKPPLQRQSSRASTMPAASAAAIDVNGCSRT